MTGNARSALDVCTPPLTPTSNYGKPENDVNGGVNGVGGDEIVEYTLKPATRAYASTARYGQRNNPSRQPYFPSVSHNDTPRS